MIKFITTFVAFAFVAGLLYFRMSVVPKTLETKKQLIDFKALKRPTTPNFYLSCPKGLCKAPDAISPTFKCSVESLKSKWQAIAKENHLTLILEKGGSTRFYALSKLFHFPDLIDVTVYPLTEDSATLAIYSHALFGYSDFGVNKRRVLTLLRELQNECK